MVCILHVVFESWNEGPDQHYWSSWTCQRRSQFYHWNGHTMICFPRLQIDRSWRLIVKSIKRIVHTVFMISIIQTSFLKKNITATYITCTLLSIQVIYDVYSLEFKMMLRNYHNWFLSILYKDSQTTQQPKTFFSFTCKI